MSDLVQVSYVFVSSPGAEATHLHMNKTDSPFLITFENDAANPSSTLEIYVVFWHTLVR